MNSQQEFSKNILANHLVKTFFHTNAIKCSAGKIILGFNIRDEFSSGSFGSAGILGLVVDYMARIAGHDPIGCCFVLEHEINIHSQTLSTALAASARIESTNNQNATFYCKIFSVENSKNRLIAESHGTLLTSDS